MKEVLDVVKGGIDTIEVELNGKYVEELKGIRTILHDKTSRNVVEDKTRVAIKPNKELSSVSQAVECIAYTMDRIGCSGWKITRVDMSIDFRNKLENNLNLGRLFLGCLAIVKKINLDDLFNTKKGIEEQGNLKIETKRFEITIYNCEDKNRMANMRVEFKSKDIRNQMKDKEKIINEVKGVLEDLKELDKLVEKVEEYNIQKLTNLYNKTIGKKYRTFSEFVAFADSQGYVMTSDILKGLMYAIGIKQNSNTFSKNFRRLRTDTLNFVSKKDLKKFLKDLEKNLKIALKN